MSMNEKMGRRAMLGRLGLVAGAAYVAPAMLQLSVARASGGSGASGGGSGASGGSGGGGRGSGGSSGSVGRPFQPAQGRRRNGSGGSVSRPSGRRVLRDARSHFRRLFSGWI